MRATPSLSVFRKEAVPAAIDAEFDGLDALKRAGAPTPHVIERGSGYLLLEHLEAGPRDSAAAARALAALHGNTSDRFGYHRDNYIGRLVQVNARHDDLPTFFSECRYRPMAKTLKMNIDALCGRLPELFAGIDELPALLHGDLWGGNLIHSTRGPVFIDPAVYYGPREADIAMTKLFGGFDEEFYRAYEADYSLPIGWRERVDLFNLYHLMTHAIMFGGGYHAQALAIVRRYS